MQQSLLLASMAFRIRSGSCMPDLWVQKRFHRLPMHVRLRIDSLMRCYVRPRPALNPNSALLTDTYLALRASSGAVNRGR